MFGLRKPEYAFDVVCTMLAVLIELLFVTDRQTDTRP